MRLWLTLLLCLTLLPGPACAQYVMMQAESEEATWPYNPDLPENVPTGALPANWNASADHTPANGTALQALLDDFGGTLQAGDVIQLTAGIDYGYINIPSDVQGGADNWIVIRSSDYADLPSFGTGFDNRLALADDEHLAILSRVPSAVTHYTLNFQGGTGVPGCSYIRLIGIKIQMTGSYGSDVSGMVLTNSADNLSADIDELPHHIVFDRCLFTHDEAMKGINDTINFDMDDSCILGCYFYNLYGAGTDGSNAIRTYTGHRLRIENNYMNCMGASYFLGDNAAREIEDVLFVHNWHYRPLAWDDGGHGTSKGSLETKAGLRVLIKENVFENHWGNGAFQAITLKSDGLFGPKCTRHVTVEGNLIKHAYMGMLVHVNGSTPGAEVGPNRDFLIKNNLMYDLAQPKGIFMTVANAAGDEILERVQIINNTMPDGDLRSDDSQLGAYPGQGFICRDNIVGGSYGYLEAGTDIGAESLNNAWGNTFNVTNNLFIGQSASFFDSDASPAPLGTLTANAFPANVSAVGFTDSGNDDYSLSNGSGYATASSTGGKPGYDSATYDPIWAEVTGN